MYPESWTFFLNASRQVERLSETVYTVVFKIALQFVILPRCISSYCVYFITDAENDSFQLPIPLW